MSNEEIGTSGEDLAGLRIVTQKGLAHFDSILLRKRRYVRQAQGDEERQKFETQVGQLQEEIRNFRIFMENMMKRVMEK